MPIIQNQVVDIHGWLSLSEFTDLVTISQMTPGPIAINAATFVGIRIAGLPGAVIATLGCIVPSCIIVSLITLLYTRYQNLRVMEGVLRALRPAVVAMIGSAGLSILISAFWGSEGVIQLRETRLDNVILFVAAVFLIQKKKWNPIAVMVLAGVAKVGLSLL